MEDCADYPGGCMSGCPSGRVCGSNDQPEHGVTVSAFALDKYEVTVGRFRKFVEAYPGSWPAVGAGANPHIGSASLSCGAGETWTDAAGPNETKAMNCVSWYDALAFCIWDAGRLPTEAEWEHVAAAGSETACTRGEARSRPACLRT